MPAITTPFDDAGDVDHAFLARHAAWMVDAGATAVVPLGSLGEGATLDFDEKLAVLDTIVQAVGDRVPVIPGIAALATHQAVALAQASRDKGCRGLMVLPPYVYQGPWSETRAHFAAVLEATDLPCMLYNNPIAYGTDVLPTQMVELCDRFENLRAMKESGGDVRRICANHALLGDRLALFAGLDDMAFEAVHAGAVGWIAGLVNALPRESVEVFRLARAGEHDAAFALYSWFLPLLRLDTVPEFVQLIKLVQQEVGMGHERVRAPRRILEGERREQALEVIRTTLASNPMNERSR
jgi:4-hydroxy-tetrahydrodipicolinate synthase